MKNPAIGTNRIVQTDQIQPEKVEVRTPDAGSPPHGRGVADTGSQHAHPVQQGQARAAGLRNVLEQKTRASETKTPASAGVVIKYASDQRTVRRARSEHPEDVVPLDEEIHQLTGESPNKSRDTQLRRKQVLAQRRQVDRGFKSVKPERDDHSADLMLDGWGDDH